MKPTTRILIPLFAGLALIPCSADTIHLTNGQKLEGRVLEEGADFYQLEVQITRTIKDQRRVPKSEVSRIDKTQDDAKDFAKIAALSPTPDLLEPSDYTQRITIVEEFLRKHGKSSSATQATKILEDLQKEAEVIRAGGVKLGGLMLSAADREDNALDVDSRIALAKMQSQVKSGNLFEAMRAHAPFLDDFVGTESSKEANQLAKSILPQLQAQLTTMIAEQPKKLAEREAGLAAMNVNDRNRAKELLAVEEAAFKKRYDEERKQRVQWIAVDEYHKESLATAQRTVQVVQSKIDKNNVDATVDTGLLYRNAVSTIKKGDTKEINDALIAANNARMSRTYSDRLAAMAKASQAAPKEAPAPEAPAPAPQGEAAPANPAPAPAATAEKK